MDVGVVALIALNNMLFAFLIWVLPRSAVVLAVALGLSSAFFLLYMPSLWLSLEAGAAALVTAVLILLILADVIVEVAALAKAYLAAGAVAGLLAGALLALMVVATATPETVPEIAREAGVSVEEARVLDSALFGAAVGVGFAMFVAWLLTALLWWLLEWWFLEPRVDLPRPLLLVTPGLLAAAVFLALAFFQVEPKDAALVAAAALAASPVFQKLKEGWTRQP
jgi:multisubunit Na+/H+ antiporter MnhB subunit